MSYQKDGCAWKFVILLLPALTLFLLLGGCGSSKEIDKIRSDGMEVSNADLEVANEYQSQTVTFKLANGYTMYRYEGYYETVFVSSTGHFQVIPKRQRVSAQ